MQDSRKNIAVYAITKHGIKHAGKLKEAFPDADLFIPKKFMEDAPQNSMELPLPMGPTLSETFQRYNCHIFVISVGAVVRMIAPLIVDKKVDPAVICVDDKAQFSICLLSGHVGRGNSFALDVAQVLGSAPVITTASDVQGTLTVDILGRELGWSLADKNRNVTRGCAAVVNEAKVMFIQEAGAPQWWPLNQSLPKGVEYAVDLDSVSPKDFEILLIATDRTNLFQTHPEHYQNSVIYHPKSLVLGVGCDRDTPMQAIESAFLKALSQAELSIASIKAIASVDRKKDEQGIVELSKKYNWPIQTYPAEILDQVEGIENPSEMAKKYVGTQSVCEASALLAAGAKRLLVPKQKYLDPHTGKNCTISIARIPYPKRENRI